MFLPEQGDGQQPGLPPLLGWAGVLPGLAGLVAVALLWKDRHELSS